MKTQITTAYLKQLFVLATLMAGLHACTEPASNSNLKIDLSVSSTLVIQPVCRAFPRLIYSFLVIFDSVVCRLEIQPDAQYSRDDEFLHSSKR